MNFSSISQFALLAIGIAIVFTYIEPTFGDIKALQDELFQYTDAHNKASELNQKLASLVSEVNQFRRSDLDALETFLPDQVDSIAVMADIEAITRQHGMQLVSLAAQEVQEGNTDVVLADSEVFIPDYTTYQDFSLAVTGSYSDLKRLLEALERNKYGLEIVRLQFGTESQTANTSVTSAAVPTGGYSLTLRAYAFSDAEIVDPDASENEDIEEATSE